jgi:hypothetical protein
MMAPMSAAPLFHVEAQLAVPTSLTMDKLRENLRRSATSLVAASRYSMKTGKPSRLDGLDHTGDAGVIDTCKQHKLVSNKVS